MTKEQLQSWRLEQARKSGAGHTENPEYCNAIAIEFARIVTENVRPVEDDAEVLNNALADCTGGYRERIPIIRAALDKRATDAQAKPAEANAILDRIAAQADKWGSNSSLYELRAILAERDAPHTSGYADGG